jgi:hypothetical protein
LRTALQNACAGRKSHKHRDSPNLFWEDVFEPYRPGPRFPIAVVQDIFNVFPFHFLKDGSPRLRGCLKERSSVGLTKDHGPALVGVSDSSLVRRFCARFSGFHSITVFEIEAGAFFDAGDKRLLTSKHLARAYT